MRMPAPNIRLVNSAVVPDLENQNVRLVNSAVVPDLEKECNHRIANHLMLLVGTAQSRAMAIGRGPKMLPSESVRELLQDIAAKIVGVAHLHRKLSEHGDRGPVDLGNYLNESCMVLVSSLGLGGRLGIVQRLDADCRVTTEQAQAIVMIANEVIMNAMKHAHPTGMPVQIHLGCRRTRLTSITVEIEDDGVGLPEGFDWKTSGGMGFALIRSLASSIGAVVTVESDSLGTTLRLEVPRSAG